MEARIELLTEYRKARCRYVKSHLLVVVPDWEAEMLTMVIDSDRWQVFARKQPIHSSDVVIEIIEQGAAKTPFMKFGDRVRMAARDTQGREPFGVIEQKVVRAP